MTREDLAQLAPYFDATETYVNGHPVDWSVVNALTMVNMKLLRVALGAPILLIRGPHPNRSEAVDACCPSVPLRRVVMELCRLPQCSWGVYSGNSFHLDTRPYETVPARWMAVHEAERPVLVAHGLQRCITSERDGWLYLPWSHASAWELLEIVVALADAKKSSTKSLST